MANTTNYMDHYYNGPSTLTTAASGVSYTTTTDASSQQWYYYDYKDHLVKSDGPPIQTRDLPSHSHGGGDNGNWTIQVPKNNGMFYDGKEIMKYNGDVQFRVKDKWVSVEDLFLRLKTLEMITERLYNTLSPWQRKQLNVDEMMPEDKKDEIEHLDPDLFKV